MTKMIFHAITLINAARQYLLDYLKNHTYRGRQVVVGVLLLQNQYL